MSNEIEGDISVESQVSLLKQYCFSTGDSLRYLYLSREMGEICKFQQYVQGKRNNSMLANKLDEYREYRDAIAFASQKL